MMSHVLTPYQMVMQNTISPVIDHRDEIKGLVNDCVNAEGYASPLYLCSLCFQYGYMLGKRDERQKKNKNVVVYEKTTDEDYRKTINKMLDDIHDPKKLKQIYTQIQWHYVRENNGCQEVHS